MKTLGKIIGLIYVLLLSMQLHAQYLSFDKVEFDYGIIPNNSVSTKAIFSCTNRGSETITIQKIETSIPGITCELTRKDIEPGTRSTINVSLNPKKLKSLFTEYITVYTTDKMLSKIVLTLKGTVKNLDPAIEQLYPNVFDVVRMTTLNLNLGTIYYPATVVDTIVVYNPQDTAVTMLFPNVPNYMTVQMYPEVIQPNSSSLMVISYDSKLRKEWGAIYDKLYLGFRGKKINYKMRVSISGTITEDFSNLTPEQIENAPKITFENTTFNFDTVHKGDPVEYKFHFKNEGKSTLEIRKIKTSCGCTAGSMDKLSYEPGEDGYVTVTLNTRNKHGNVHQTVTIISNDPKNTESKVVIQGVVVD